MREDEIEQLPHRLNLLTILQKMKRCFNMIQLEIKSEILINTTSISLIISPKPITINKSKKTFILLRTLRPFPHIHPMRATCRTTMKKKFIRLYWKKSCLMTTTKIILSQTRRSWNAPKKIWFKIYY